MRAGIFAVLLAIPGCASTSAVKHTVEELPAVTLHVLNVAKSIHAEFCLPEPLPGKEKICEDAKEKINLAGDKFNEYNEAL